MVCCNIITMHVLGQVSFYKIQQAINTWNKILSLEFRSCWDLAITSEIWQTNKQTIKLHKCSQDRFISPIRLNTILETFVASMFFWVSWKQDLDRILFLTSLLCFLKNSGTVWSIPNRSECQYLKFIFCILIKPSDFFSVNCLTANELHASRPWRAFLFEEQFISFDDSISGVFWW